MKRSVIMTAVLLIALNFDFFILKAQSPDLMSYQAVIRDGNGALVRNKQVNIRISILQGAVDGNSVFSEEHVTTTNDNGLVSIVIGSGRSGYTETKLKASAPADQATLLSGDFTTIKWDEGPYFIKVETDPDGGTNYTIVGTSQLLSVPYALYAKKSADSKFADGVNADDAVYTKGNVGIGTTEPRAPLHVKTDSVPAFIIESKYKNDPDRPGIQFRNNTSHFISGDGLSDEYFGFYSNWSNTREFDAKLRVFGKASASWGKYLEMTHDGTNGTIRTDAGDINITPKEDLNLTPDGNLNLNPVGSISAGDKNISNVAQPVAPNDVVTKAYIDNIIEYLLDLTGYYPIIDFSASSTNMTYTKLGNFVKFEDRSVIMNTNKNENKDVSSKFTKHLWDFGDGSTSTEEKPYHLYKNVGSYTVKLTVSLGPKTETIERKNYIKVLKTLPTVTDYDGNVYPAVWIGDKLWMAENLKVTHYPNGDPIAYSGDFTTCDNYIRDDIGTYFYYNFNNALGVEYGYLYSVDAAKNWSKDNKDGQGVCPDGWHIPTNEDWNDLKNFLGTYSNFYGYTVQFLYKIREKGTEHWNSDDDAITNETGFTLLGSGRYEYGGSFRYLKERGEFWLVTGDTGTNVADALAVRCVKDY